MISLHSSPFGELGTLDTGGMSVYIRELAQQLGQSGHHVDIFTRLTGPSHPSTTDLSPQVRLIHLAIGGDGRLGKADLYPRLSRYFSAMEARRRRDGMDYDLVHSHYWLSGRLGNWVQNQWHIPHVTTFHTLEARKTALSSEEQNRDLRLANERRLVRQCDGIISVTAREESDLARLYGADPGKVRVIPCGVNLELFRPRDRAESRKRLGFENDEQVLLYVGRFSLIKGIRRLLKALSLVDRDRAAPIRLVIVGGERPQSPVTQDLARLASRLGIPDLIRFTGNMPQEQLPDYYSAADLLVVPSDYESFSLVGLEALACGTPVVATPVGAMTDLVRNSRTGFIVKDHEPESLAEGIRRGLEHFPADDLRSRFIRSTVLSHGWRNVAATVVEEYRRMLKGRLSSTEKELLPEASSLCS